MKTTAFTKFHVDLGAKMVPFAGFSMPVEFTGINDEHNTVREKAGVFDVSHMGEIFVSGPHATDFLQYITSNDVSSLVDGKVQYSCLPNGHGGIVDDVLVYRYNAHKYLVVVNSSNTEKDWNWCLKHAGEFGLKQGTDIINASDSIAQLAVQGPLALKAMQKLTPVPVENMEYYTFKELEFAGIKDVLFSTTGYTGSGGCEIYVKNEDGPALWKAVFDAGREFGIKPIGLGARDTLRLEMGFCLYGNDINDETSPIEAGLGWITKFNKNFIDKEFLLDQKKNGVSRKLRGFIMDEKAIPRQHYEVFDKSGKKIGEVTSGTMSPVLKQGIGMAYLVEGFWNAGTEIYIRIRNKDVRAHVVEMPFYKKQS